MPSMQRDICYICHQRGHWSSYCPSKSSNNKPDSTTPQNEISSNLEKRMQQDICYICKQKGHWSWYCPSKSPTTKPDSSTPQNEISSNFEKRMQQDTCYICKQKGHWSWYCPSKSPTTKLDSSTPQNEISSNLEKRMEQDICYICKQKGHWSWYCPSKSPKRDSPVSPNMTKCSCGHGFCEVKTSHNRCLKYYTCPIKKGEKCKEFVMWCDDHIYDRDLQPPPFKYPECECGAGVCRRVQGTESHEAFLFDPQLKHKVFKYYFACPIQGDGSCGYRVSEDELLNNSKNIVPIQQTREKIDNDQFGNKLFKGNGLQVQIKPMKITHYCGNPSSMAIFEIPDKKDSRPKGWLGRLLFFNPSQSLKFPTPQPFFCCVFPSFNPIRVPKQTIILDGSVTSDECNTLANSSVCQRITQLSIGYHTMEEQNKPFEKEKQRFSQLQDHYVKTKALLEASNHHKQLLSEQVSTLKAMLHEKQNQLQFCEFENLKIETRFGDLKRSMLETNIMLKGRVEQTEVARKLSEERQAKQIAAKRALEKIKLELED